MIIRLGSASTCAPLKLPSTKWNNGIEVTNFSNFAFNSGLYWLSSQFTKTLCESVSFEFNHSENFSLSNRDLKIASKVPGIILLEKNDLIGNLSRLSEHTYPHASKIGRNSSMPARITILFKSEIVSPLLKNTSPNL